MAGTPDPQRSRAVLIGASNYRTMKPVPAVLENLSELARVLGDLRIWGLPEENCRVVTDPETSDDLLDPLRQAAIEAEDTLLLYYSGHGLGHPLERKLLLTHVNSDAQKEWSTVEYLQLRRVMSESRAFRQVIILDCCYSGLAIGALADPPTVLVNILPSEFDTEGTYVLTATAENVPALAPENERFTAFTAELLNVMERGVPGHGALLDLRSIYVALLSTMRLKKMPEPRNLARDTAADLTLIRNRAFKQRTTQEQAESGTAPYQAAAQFDDDAIAVTQSSNVKAYVVSTVSPLSGTKREVYRNILINAERAAGQIPDQADQASALCRVAIALATVDPKRSQEILDRAETIARNSDPVKKAGILGSIAGAWARFDPQRSDLILTEAKEVPHGTEPVEPAKPGRWATRRTRERINRAWEKAREEAREEAREVAAAAALQGAAAALARADPERAESIAKTIEQAGRRDSALAEVAIELADTDPERAEDITRDISNSSLRDHTLSCISSTLARVDVVRAEQVLGRIQTSKERDRPRRDVAVAFASIDSGRAEHIAQSIIDETGRFAALADIARALATADPARAEQVANSIAGEAERSAALAGVAAAFVDTDRGGRILDEAEQIAKGVAGGKYEQVSALTDVAVALIGADTTRSQRILGDAEHIARGILEKVKKDDHMSLREQLPAFLALGTVATGLAAVDLNRSQKLLDEGDKDSLVKLFTSDEIAGKFRKIAIALAVVEPDRAELIVLRNLEGKQRTSTLKHLAMVQASVDLGRAERIVGNMSDMADQASTLIDIARTLETSSTAR
jgi:hypothetical protein